MVMIPQQMLTKSPRHGSFASLPGKTLDLVGRPFVQLVLEALDANCITAVDACRYLDLRWDYVEKLRLELRAGPADSPRSQPRR